MDALAHEQFVSLERNHWWFRGRRAVCGALVRHALRDAQPEAILDIGSGSGGFLDLLRSTGVEPTAIEWDLDACRRARTRVDGPAGQVGPGGVLSGSAERLPFADAAFDLVTMFDVLEHLEEPQAAAREAWRVLKPGGALLVHVPAHPWLFAENDRVAGHHRRYTRAELRRTLRGAGLTAERVAWSNVLLFPLIAPLVLALGWAERVGLRPEGRTNLSVDPPRWVHALLASLYGLEARWVARFDLWPGHSLAAIARRPLAATPALDEEDAPNRPTISRPRAGRSNPSPRPHPSGILRRPAPLPPLRPSSER